MNDQLLPKPMKNSVVVLSQLMHPEHANNQGNVHGGWIMKLVDECGALACMRHGQRRVVTVALDGMTFKQPIRIGDLITLTGMVTFTGRTSLEAVVSVTAENPLTGTKTHTNQATLVYVALDADGNPTPIPPVFAETDEEKKLQEEARARHAARRR